MVLEQDFANAIQELVKKEHANIAIGESTIHIHVFEENRRLSLSTVVYQGEAYIPDSIRREMHHKFPFARKIHTYLQLEEASFAIQLRYLGDLEAISKKEFRSLLEEFAQIADDWRTFFDDWDKKDRIHVPNKPKSS